MDLPLCSIIIPTHGRPEQLLECLDSLSELDYPRSRVEVVVVDDGNEPPLAGIADRYEGRLNLLVLRQERSGPAAARNVGAAHANGDILAFTDDDCRPEPGWLCEMAGHLHTHPDHMAGGSTTNGLPGNAYSSASQTIIDAVYAYYNANPRDARFFASNNIAMSAGRFEAIGGFDTRFRTSEDRDLCDRWLRTGGSMAYLPGARVRHFHHLTFRGFVRQHFHYGRGARRFLEARLDRGDTDFNHPPNFYRMLLAVPLAERRVWRSFRSALLLMVSQGASLVGFTREKVRADPSPKTGRGRSTSVAVSEKSSSCFAASVDAKHVGG
jgi:GT2 family glycosyltransferase